MLTPKQQKFCDEYLIDLNATQAALRAGYSGSTALNGQLMNIPKIRLYLQQRTETVARQVQCNHQMVLSELMKIAFGNMGNYFRSDGTMKAMHELTADEKAGLWSVTVTDGDRVTTRIRMNNKMAALEKIAKHLRFYEAEAEPPEKVFVYVDKDKLDNHDRFDDELFYDDDDNENEFYDDCDEEYYPWDTECVIAVAQARAACKERKRQLSVVGGELSVEEEEDSLESGAGSSESGEFEEDDVSLESEVKSSESDVEFEVGNENGGGRVGVIDFGSGRKGTCQVPFMMGNSREYRSW